MKALIGGWASTLPLLFLLVVTACDDNDSNTASCSDCDRNTEYCVMHGSDVVGVDDAYACEPLPPNCATTVECACLDGAEASFNLPWCLELGGCVETDNGLMVTCPGG